MIEEKEETANIFKIEGIFTVFNQTGIRCLNCKSVLVSLGVHDWRACRCFENVEGNKGCFIDGGNSYTRIGGNKGDYERFTANWALSKDTGRILFFEILKP